jgi:hypothetical protein
MTTKFIRGLTVVAALSAGLIPATAPANAQPNISEAGLSSQSALTKVQWRGHRGYWRGHRGWDGDGVGLGLGVAGALLGGAIIANEYDGDGYYDGTAYDGDDGVGRCAATFRSFDPNTGTYVGYDGIVRPCPYL